MGLAGLLHAIDVERTRDEPRSGVCLQQNSGES
jgi:hypothetical protein